MLASFTFIASSLVNLLQNRAMEGILFLLFVDIYRFTMNITLIIPPKLKQLTDHLGLYLYFSAKTGTWFCFKRK